MKLKVHFGIPKPKKCFMSGGFLYMDEKEEKKHFFQGTRTNQPTSHRDDAIVERRFFF